MRFNYHSFLIIRIRILHLIIRIEEDSNKEITAGTIIKKSLNLQVAGVGKIMKMAKDMVREDTTTMRGVNEMEEATGVTVKINRRIERENILISEYSRII